MKGGGTCETDRSGDDSRSLDLKKAFRTTAQLRRGNLADVESKRSVPNSQLRASAAHATKVTVANIEASRRSRSLGYNTYANNFANPFPITISTRWRRDVTSGKILVDATISISENARKMRPVPVPLLANHGTKR